MARLLVWSDGGCTTGFSRVTHELCTRFVENGHTVDVLAINFRGELEPPFDTAKYKLHVPTKHNANDLYGVGRINELVVKLDPDIIVMINDLPVLAAAFTELEKLNVMPATVVYLPIDCANLPNSWGVTAEMPDSVIAYTQFGKIELEKATARRDYRIAYHGMDHSVFTPVSRENPAILSIVTGSEVAAYTKDQIKLAYGLDDKFVILWVDRNSQRKYAAGFLKAIAPFVRRHDDVAVYMHCAVVDQGCDIEDMTSKYRLGDRIWLTPAVDTFNGVTDDTMNAIYNMADVKISTALGEGAGLTNMEALACGVPVIAQDFSANREMLGPGALYVHSAFMWTAPRGCDSSYPKIEEYDEQLEKLYQDSKRREQVGEWGREHVSRFKWDDAVKVFEEEFVRVQQLFEERKVVD